MDVAPFALERWFADHEPDADVMLAESGIRALRADRFDLDPGRLGYAIPTNGDPDLRAEIAERSGRDPDEVLCTVGTQEANFLAFAALLDASSHAVVVTPTYQSLHAVPAAFGSVTRVPLSPPDWRLDPDDVAAAVRPETELVVCNDPNNPTGRHHDRETLAALYDVAVDADAYLLCDEVYRLLADDPRDPVASMGPHGLSTAGVSKAHGLAGCRFGWLVGDRAVVEAAWEWKDYTTISPSPLGQHVAAQALGEREAAILEENRALAARNRERVAGFVERLGLDWHRPVGVNAFPTVPDGFADGRAFCRRVVEEAGVVLAPGDAFGHPDRFRLGFGLPTAELEEGLDRVERVVAGA
ncbi:MAG: aminotransferase class I/II-fold pyridoxal phosphate-dependent enzyme [Haloferacaceae archaeon]